MAGWSGGGCPEWLGGDHDLLNPVQAAGHADGGAAGGGDGEEGVGRLGGSTTPGHPYLIDLAGGRLWDPAEGELGARAVLAQLRMASGCARRDERRRYTLAAW